MGCGSLGPLVYVLGTTPRNRWPEKVSEILEKERGEAGQSHENGLRALFSSIIMARHWIAMDILCERTASSERADVLERHHINQLASA